MLQLAHKEGTLYQQALALTKELYRLTAQFPDQERAVLVYNLRRLAVTLCQNLATGAMQKGKKRTRLFQGCLENCIGIDTQLEIAIAVAFISPEETQEAARHLNGLYKEIETMVQSKKKNSSG